MKLAGKLEKPDEVKAHLQELSDFQVPVRLFTKEGKFLLKGCFSCEFNSDASLFFSPVLSDWSQYATLACHYSYRLSACAFQARPLGLQNSQLQLDLPASILFFDRRKYFRIQPSKNRPVVIRFAIPGKSEMRVSASDISGGGFSVLVPARMNFFSIGRPLFTRLALSGEEKIECQVTVKGLFSFLDVTRVGCEFNDICEKDRSVVMSHCVRRELETRNAPDARENQWKQLNLCIIDEASDPKPYAFLEGLFYVKTIEPLNAISHLRQTRPDLMMLNTDNAGARLVLQTVSRDPVLAQLPLILLGRKRTNANARSGGLLSVRTPYKKPYLLKTMKEFVENIRLSKEVGQSYWQYFPGEGKKIVIVDPLKNLASFPFKALEDLEFQLDWVKGGEGILGQIEVARPDVLLLDNETGSLDPGTLCRLMNMNKVLKNIPKIRLIAGGEVPHSTLFENSGMSFLAKPLEMEKLVESINTALGRGI
jgi:CheY-like chemotaxis protein